MVRLVQRTELWPTFQGFEPSAISANDVALFTGNWFAAFSVDNGNSFASISPYDVMRWINEDFCCDQRLDFVPSIDTFAWVLLSLQGSVMLVVARPDDIRTSNGTQWIYYTITPGALGRRGDRFDYPQIAYGLGYLYLTLNFIDSGGSAIFRLPLGHLNERITITGQYVMVDQWMVCPAHNTADEGWFGSFKSESKIRVFTWKEGWSEPVVGFDVDIPTVPTMNFSSTTQEGDDWLPPTSKIQAIITGAARSGNDLWLSWSAGRTYANGTDSPFPHAHIGLAIIDVPAKHLREQRNIWNEAWACAWPSLAANFRGEVGISFCWGGGSRYPRHAVGILTGAQRLMSTRMAARSAGSGGHYVDIRTGFPMLDRFVAAGHVSLKNNATPPVVTSDPYYVVFEP